MIVTPGLALRSIFEMQLEVRPEAGRSEVLFLTAEWLERDSPPKFCLTFREMLCKVNSLDHYLAGSPPALPASDGGASWKPEPPIESIPIFCHLPNVW